MNIFGPKFAVVRLNTDGSLDGSFGRNGIVVTDFGGYNDIAHAAIVQPDDKILVAGRAEESLGGFAGDDFALARYNTDGSPDPTFGYGGRVTTNFGSNNLDDIAYAVAIQPDGKIIAAGSVRGYYRNADLGLARYTPEGSLDTSFGTDGIFTRTTYREAARAIALQPDGRIVIGGTSGGDFLLARFKGDGTPDEAFGSNGTVTTDFFGLNNNDIAYAVAIDSAGRITAAGTAARSNTDHDFALARYTPEGRLDEEFGQGGRVTTDFFGREDIAYALATQPDGRLVVAGSAAPPDTTNFFFNPSADFALARYRATAGVATPPQQSPYGGTPRQVPGRIEAEDYDEGGQHVAYYDTTPGNEGGVYRADNVDIKASSDEGGGGYAIGWFNAGEWLKYTVEVAEAGTYDLEVRVGSALPDRTFRIEVDGRDVTGLINVPLTGEWDTYETVRVGGIEFAAGLQTMRVVMGAENYMDLNWINIVPHAAH